MLVDSDFVKIRTAVPLAVAPKVRQALYAAGAGEQGHYTQCSSSIQSLGRFTPQVGANPAVGQVGKAEEVPEEIIEILCHKDKLPKVIVALKRAHPYDEPAIDIIPRLEIE